MRGDILFVLCVVAYEQCLLSTLCILCLYSFCCKGVQKVYGILFFVHQILLHAPLAQFQRLFENQPPPLALTRCPLSTPLLVWKKRTRYRSFGGKNCAGERRPKNAWTGSCQLRAGYVLSFSYSRRVAVYMLKTERKFQPEPFRLAQISLAKWIQE